MFWARFCIEKKMTFENVADKVTQNKAFKAAKELNTDRYRKWISFIDYI